MYVLSVPAYASPKTQGQFAEHNQRVSDLGADQTAAKRLVEAAAAADPLTTDTSATKEAAVQRQREVMRREADLQRERIPLLRLLQIDRKAAERAAEVELERVKQETIDGLQKLGFGAWLADANPIVAQSRLLAIGSATPVAAALQRFDMLQDDHHNFLVEEGAAAQRIRELTARIESLGYPRGLAGFSERLLASGNAR